MNKLRKTWKNNGTPFYFSFNFDGIRIYISSDICKQLDNISFDNLRFLSCLDLLVDIVHVLTSLNMCSDTLLIHSVKYELFQLVQLVLRRANLVPDSSNSNHFVFNK